MPCSPPPHNFPSILQSPPTMARTFASFLITLFCFFFMANASPMKLVAKGVQDVFVPQIIKPDATTVWVTGELATVEWYLYYVSFYSVVR